MSFTQANCLLYRALTRLFLLTLLVAAGALLTGCTAPTPVLRASGGSGWSGWRLGLAWGNDIPMLEISEESGGGGGGCGGGSCRD